MDKEDIAYCGLDCELCKSKFADIRKKSKFSKKHLKRLILKKLQKQFLL